MAKISIGPGLESDLSVLVDTRLLVQANSGGGKSWCLRRLLEQTHGRIQQLVIDPEGEFASLREHFDYVLAASHGGDTAAHPRLAGMLAERLLELEVSAILDIYELKAHDRVRFVRHFLEALIDAPKRLWHPALVVVDEAHVYAPQTGEAESAGAVIDLATRGRKRGYAAVLATQRLSKLHKDAAAELNNKLIGRTGLDVDVKRAADELGFGKERWRELRELDPGQFFAFGPALSRAVTAVRVGPVITTHPKAGARLGFTPPPPTAKVKALLPKLADLPAEAEERQRSMDDLRREVIRLRGDLARAQRAVPAPPAPKVVERQVVKDADVRRLEAAVKASQAAMIRAMEVRGKQDAALQEVAGRIGQTTEALLAQLAKIDGRAPAGPTLPDRPRFIDSSPRLAKRDVNPADGLTGPEQRILDALAWMESIGVPEAEQPAVAFLAGYTIGGGAFNNPRGSLRSKGLLEYRSDRLALTEEGRKLANAPEAALTHEVLQERVLARLPGPERKILGVVLNAYPKAIDNDTLAREAGYEPGGGAFNNPRGRLRSLGLITYPERGMIRASDALFLKASR